MSTLMESINMLGWDLLHHLQTKQPSSNGIIVSPLSITIALAMLAGAAGAEQKTQLCTKMGIADSSKLNSAFVEILTPFNENVGSLIESANGVFLRDGVAPNAAYLEFLEVFAAEVRSYPNLAEATDQINGWISEHTKGLIRKMLSKSILLGAELVVVNAVVFKGLWHTPFRKIDTKPRYPFNCNGGSKRLMEMMFLHGKNVQVADQDTSTTIRLPYQQASDEMTVYFQATLPAEGQTLMDILPTIRNCRHDFQRTTLADFGLPKFQTETMEDVTSLLVALGVSNFCRIAIISGDYKLHGGWPALSTTTRGPASDLVIHKAIIKVDEEGTVAAAATAVVARKGRPPPHRSIIFDRPFAYSIVDGSGLSYFTGTIE